MARWFRIWEKKRGRRRTGSKLWGGVGEGLFFLSLFLLGTTLLAALITSQLTAESPDDVYFSGWVMWLVVLLLVSFVLIGGVGVAYAVLRVGASDERRAAIAKGVAELDLAPETPRSNPYPTVPNDDQLTNSPGVVLAYRLPADRPAGWRLFAAAGIAIAWSAFAVFLVVLGVQRVSAGDPEWAFLIFASLMAVAGLAGMVYFVRMLLTHSVAGPTGVEVSEHPLQPDGRYELFLSQSGHFKLRWLEASLVCEEEATFRQGTDVRIETHRTFERQLFRHENLEIKPGRAYETRQSFQTPAGAMHSFQSEHNAIQWKLVIRGRPESWPLFERAYPVIMRPHPRTDSKSADNPDTENAARAKGGRNGSAA